MTGLEESGSWGADWLHMAEGGSAVKFLNIVQNTEVQ